MKQQYLWSKTQLALLNRIFYQAKVETYYLFKQMYISNQQFQPILQQ
ncbi:unnamed protein product [Paramecium octaurelia]|uniref:Uncharacterized protein n=1 Tax=Paramecium octaurelia TaxID=43137 RepID=A0A8S1TDN5_PAROT|nr:unnamed protein product [Paramecium octaurelia]